MRANIVMLVKDRPELTRQAITSLIDHTPAESYDLTVIDDQSQNPFMDLFSPGEWETTVLPITVLRNERSKRITGQARNLGVYWAEKFWGRGDFLYLSDNDVYFEKNWLKILTAALGTGLVSLIGGGTHPFHGINQILNCGDLNGQLGYLHAIHTHDAVSGYSHLVRWETWDKYGPMDAHAVGVGQSEDWKFCQDIIKDGGQVGTVWPEVVYATGLTDTFGKPAVGSDQMRRYPGIIQM